VESLGGPWKQWVVEGKFTSGGEMMKVFKPLLILVVISLLLVACGPTPTPLIITREVEKEVVVTKEVEKIVTQEVEKEVVVTKEVEKIVEVTPEPIGGELILYACLFDPDKLQVIFNTFKNQYGTTVTCLDMSSGEALERIRAEQENPQGDVCSGRPISPTSTWPQRI
jgi:hypothetical protein